VGRRKILKKSSSGWEDNIKKNLRELGWDGVDWIDIAWDISKWQTFVIKKN
jgi:acyl carrier protein